MKFTFIFEKMFNIVNTLIENLKSWKCFLSSKTRGKLRLKYGLHFFLCRRRRFSCISISKKPSSSFFPFTSALISESDIMIFVISFFFCFFWRLAALIIFHHSSAFKGWSLKVIFFGLKQNCYFISFQLKRTLVYSEICLLSVWTNRSIKIACLKLQLKFWVESFHLHTCSFVSRMYVKLKKTTSRRRLFGTFMNNNFNRLVWLSLFLDLDCQQIFMISLLALPNLRLGNFFPFLFLSNRNWHS